MSHEKTITVRARGPRRLRRRSTMPVSEQDGLAIESIIKQRVEFGLAVEREGRAEAERLRQCAVDNATHFERLASQYQQERTDFRNAARQERARLEQAHGTISTLQHQVNDLRRELDSKRLVQPVSHLSQAKKGKLLPQVIGFVREAFAMGVECGLDAVALDPDPARNQIIAGEIAAEVIDTQEDGYIDLVEASPNFIKLFVE